ncbi:alpha/beta fold hydrolase [Ferroacidibacillus organovorans]|uniref:Serine aminopeptidase S33 domain-containing protein n=1 Tax=Ferroacidibacillus organovorans TaxID=1765683 RepID=A0A853KCI7_9BACL|nr:alpha/beta hydrolase [Ferroacidibacillus organovorans]KYP80097.1 hypothetical protein AYJ22_12420 [Ferroacidibacillus organovorans]OAG93128.1 hypothetical protein AYW79_12290 [Ferroacidibacillus organovorans]
MIRREFEWMRGDVMLRGFQFEPHEERPKASVLIVHGMGESSERYHRFANALTDSLYAGVAYDLRGHGRTARSVDELGDMGNDGFETAYEDLRSIALEIKRSNPELPLFLFAHSMGSMLAKGALYRDPSLFQAVILSGTTGPPRALLQLGKMIAKREIKRHGAHYQSGILERLSFGSYNRAFRPNRTGYDWLSRDRDEVDRYVADPQCGKTLCAGSFLAMLSWLFATHTPENLVRIPKDLPILMISGDRDPVGEMGKGVTQLARNYKRYGLKCVDVRLYKDARHELLHELNCDQVTRDITEWMDQKLQLSLS